MPTVKLGPSRQVTIPKELHDRLGLRSGDFFEVEVVEGKLVYSPKSLVDKRIEARLEEGLADIQEGRTQGPFSSAEELVTSLRKNTDRKT